MIVLDGQPRPSTRAMRSSASTLVGYTRDMPIQGVDETDSEGHVELRPLGPTLEELVAGITPENCHGETDWGRDVGKEIVEG